MRKSVDIKIGHRAVLATVLTLLLIAVGCNNNQTSPGGMSSEERQALEEPFPASKIVEVSRSSSPDGILEAVIVTRETGATVATPTEIYLVPKGGKLSGEPSFRADHVTSISVSWPNNESLLVQAVEARPFRQEATQEVVTKQGSRAIALEYRIERLDSTGK